jgi:hypothetical protein
MSRSALWPIGKFLVAILTLASLLVLPGCWVTSLNGLSDAGLFENDGDQTFDAGLLGTYGITSDNCASTLTITAKEKTYEWEMTGVGEGCNQDKLKSYYEGQLFKLDNHLFFDLTARPDDVCDVCRAVHWIFLVQIEKDSFSMVPIDSDWLKNAVQNKTASLETLPDDTDTITASGKELKAFCRKYADNKEAFTPLSDFTFKRK